MIQKSVPLQFISRGPLPIKQVNLTLEIHKPSQDQCKSNPENTQSLTQIHVKILLSCMKMCYRGSDIYMGCGPGAVTPTSMWYRGSDIYTRWGPGLVTFTQDGVQHQWLLLWRGPGAMTSIQGGVQGQWQLPRVGSRGSDIYRGWDPGQWLLRGWGTGAVTPTQEWLTHITCLFNHFSYGAVVELWFIRNGSYYMLNVGVRKGEWDQEEHLESLEQHV